MEKKCHGEGIEGKQSWVKVRDDREEQTWERILAAQGGGPGKQQALGCLGAKLTYYSPLSYSLTKIKVMNSWQGISRMSVSFEGSPWDGRQFPSAAPTRGVRMSHPPDINYWETGVSPSSLQHAF